MSFAIKSSGDTPAQEARETPAQTAQQAATGDAQAVRRLATEKVAEQKTRGGATDAGPATVVTVSAQAKLLAASSVDKDDDGDSK